MAMNPLAAAHRALRTYSLGLPAAYEDFPWGESAMKVAKKVFAFIGYDRTAGRLSLTVKLGLSNDAALGLPFTLPTRYNLGKSGWVTALFEAGSKPPVGILCDWIYESYVLVAPKKLVATMTE
ncbi:MAG: DifB protein [Candidatus Eremiobacteraeota bacterium]|jgi:predicted DNA-binding protein (MmcQ/YjbR family)|nr:DifB protein [Candidatus Eremiobacteraeota bacterium]